MAYALLVIVISLIIYYFRKQLSALFIGRFSKEVFAFILAFGTANMVTDFLHFSNFYENLELEAQNYIHHIFYILILILFTLIYSLLLNDISKRLLESIEKKYSETGAKFVEYYSVLFKLQTHNDEFKVLETLLHDYKVLSEKHQYMISLDAYLELNKRLFFDGYEAIGINNLLPPFWIAPDFQNSTLIDYINFFVMNKDKINYQRITVLKDEATANDLVGFALEQKEKSDGGQAEAYLWVLDLVEALEISETDLGQTPKFSSVEIKNNLVIPGISWNIGVKHLFNSPSHEAIQNKETEIKGKLDWFRLNLLQIANKKVLSKFKALQNGDFYYCPKEIFNQRIKTKYNWAEVAIFENKKFNREIGIAVINNIDNAILIELIVDNNVISLIKNIMSERDFKKKHA